MSDVRYQDVGGLLIKMSDAEIAQAIAAGRRWKSCDGRTVLCTDSEEAALAAAATRAAAEELAREAARQRCAGLDAAIAGDATLAQLKAMTNAEFDAWWQANVTNATQAMDVLRRLSRVILRRVL